MRQAIYRGDRSVTTVEAESESPGRGQVRLDVAYTGICGTDLHIFHGDMDGRVSIPVTIGHEMSGTIAATGPGVAGWEVGDDVTVMPLAWCGGCPACRSRNTHICHRLNFIGIDSPGSMQESWIVAADTLVCLPDGLPLRDAALIEPTAVAVHDVRRAELQPGERTVVIGGGPVGVLMAIVARDRGADIVVVEPDSYRREVAESQGLTALDPGTIDVPGWVESWTEGAGAAVAFEVSGAATGVTTAVEVLATRGRLCLVAIHSVPRELNLHRFFWRELSLIGARLYDRSDFNQAANLVASGIVPVDALVSRIVGLDDVEAAFHALESGAGVMKVLIDCRAP